MLLLSNIFCDPLLEPAHGNVSNEESHHMFSLRNKNKLSSIPLLSGAMMNIFDMLTEL